MKTIIAKRSEGAEWVLAERTRSSFCMYISEFLEPHIILKDGRRVFEWKPFIFIFLSWINNLKLTLHDPTMTLFDGLYL